MSIILQKTVKAVEESAISFSKFITANDTGATGAHQSGFHLPKNSWELFFESEGQKGSNKDKTVTIKWQDTFEKTSRVIYYGVGTRNEYRLTRFGRNFPFLQEECIGDLLVICKRSENYYEAYVLQSDEQIEDFFAQLNLSSTSTNNIIKKHFESSPERSLATCYSTYIKKLKIDFPATVDLANTARECYITSHKISREIILKYPDRELLNWIEAEFHLFKAIERDRYAGKIKKPFNSIDELVDFANTILNRRKSRAGKSLEHHLVEIFNISRLKYEAQTVTEDNKKPDFIFPNSKSYWDKSFNEKKLVVLAAKTTCKDRWRQVLNEADRVKTKHLFTLQQGISKNQLSEMYKYGVRLIVPQQYLKSFPDEFRDKILSLEKFLKFIGTLQSEK